MAKKTRTPIPDDVAAEVLYLHDYSCCICGDKAHLAIHHLDDDPSNHNLDNLAVLCLAHHEQTQLRGGFTRKLTRPVVSKARDKWLGTVIEYREAAKQLAAARLAGVPTAKIDNRSELQEATWSEPEAYGYRAFVEYLPDQLRELYKIAHPLWEGEEGGLGMVEGSNLVIEALKQSWLFLSRWFPPNHFGRPAHEYVEAYLEDRYSWHRALADADNDPRAIGSSKPALASTWTVDDAERMIVETVRMVAYRLDGFDLAGWESRWEAVKKAREPQIPTNYYGKED